MIQPSPEPSPSPQRRISRSEPYPGVRSAFLLTLLAMLAAAMIGVFFLGLGTLAAVGIGQALGVGGVATWAARRVPEPQAERLGLRALDTGALPAVLCLAPAILLASELDNFASDWSRAGEPTSGAPYEREFVTSEVEDVQQEMPVMEAEGDESARAPAAEAAPEEAEGEGKGSEEPFVDAGGEDSLGDSGQAEGGEETSPLVDPQDPWSLVQAVIIFVGIAPVVEEFLFRGVIQQGLVARLGLARGVGLVALLWALLRPAPVDDLARFLAAALSFIALGWLLGVVRIATGSILGSICLASVWAAIGLGSLALQDRIELPGLNVEGSHLPWSVSLASAAIVAWAAVTVYREACRRFARTRTP